jgi:hypothetical protein
MGDRRDWSQPVQSSQAMSENGNGTHVRISTLVKTYYQGGDMYGTISKLLERKPTGTLTLYVTRGGINSIEWEEKNWTK